jgi:ABC-type transport system involved in cytochrome c biogenesis ATPase subunit
MIRAMVVENFTVFEKANLSFAAGLNIIVGENATGKSHLLKLVYALAAVAAQGKKESGEATPSSTFLEGAAARKLMGVFRPDDLGRLARRQVGVQRCVVSLDGDEPWLPLAVGFNTKSRGAVELIVPPNAWSEKAPAFLPTRELLTIYPGFVSLYETTALPFEETWRDTCVLLGAPLLRGRRAEDTRVLLEPLEAALGGNLVEESGRFYLQREGANLEVHLVAEGWRKLAMIARLIATGSLVDEGFLFWDEPEANLNPRLVRTVAKVIAQLSKRGVQVFVATHSLFLMRELHLLRADLDLDTRCIGLHPQAGGQVGIVAGDSMDDIGEIVALDEDLGQSGRYLESEAELGRR